MRATINHKWYDTDKTPVVGERAFDGYPVDSKGYMERLQRKKTGEYYLHCMGGINSPYRKKKGISWVEGETIKQMSFDDAKRWADANMSKEDVERHFSQYSKGGKKILSASISTATYYKLKELALAGDTSVSGIIEELVENVPDGEPVATPSFLQ